MAIGQIFLNQQFLAEFGPLAQSIEHLYVIFVTKKKILGVYAKQESTSSLPHFTKKIKKKNKTFMSYTEPHINAFLVKFIHARKNFHVLLQGSQLDLVQHSSEILWVQPLQMNSFGGEKKISSDEEDRASLIIGYRLGTVKLYSRETNIVKTIWLDVVNY